MNKFLLAVMVTSIVGAPAFAGETKRASKHEAAGVGSGLVIGAAAGGPLGAILGAALGGLIGNKYHDERTARIGLEADYELASADIDDLRSQLQGRERRIAEMQQQIVEEERSYRAAVQQALNAEVFFRTGESELGQDSVERIGRIAKLVGAMDGFVVSLAGHADGRGAEDYNEALSSQRALAVRDALIAAGFPASRISVTAEGERASQAAEGDLDALAMERRVHIEVIASDSDRRVAARP